MNDMTDTPDDDDAEAVVVDQQQDDVADAEGTQEVEEAEETVVSLGDTELTADDDGAEPAPEWVKGLRKSYREERRLRKEAEAKLAEVSAKPAVQEDVLGPKPTLADFAFDEDAKDAALLEWHEKKRAIDAKAEQAKAEAGKQAEQWKAKLAAFDQSKKSLGLLDYEDAEDVAGENLDVTQRGIILHGAKNAAAVIYAIGKTPAEAKRLGEIKDPVKFAMEIGKLEERVKVAARKPQTAPEGKVVGTAPLSGGGLTRALDAAREKAAKTGDYTEVSRIKTQMAKARG